MKIKKRKYVGYVEDRLVTPYVIWKDLRTHIKYVDFPLANQPSLLPLGSPANPSIADYQQKRFYSDERLLTLKDFNKMCNK